MQPRDYQEACRRPDAFHRSGLEETLRVVRAKAPEMVPQIEQLLASPPIEKPEKHAGKVWTDFIRVSISYADAEIICGAFVDMEAVSVSPEGETTGPASYYAGLADDWYHYMTWLEEAGAEGAPGPNIPPE